MKVQEPAIETPYLNPGEAALYLRLSKRALEQYRTDGGGPVYRKHGGRVVYHKDELDAWSERRRYADTGGVDGRLGAEGEDEHI
ncbi:MAG: helix-turn-helix domain-containing protein [Parvularculaceae bacterium]